MLIKGSNDIMSGGGRGGQEESGRLSAFLAKESRFTSYELLFTIAGKGGPGALGIYDLRFTIDDLRLMIYDR